ncbi:MAG: tRNA (guanosine(37)-N1)-methyltransferase TrmD [Ruminococcaceae bacterium]|nr:tRNA (guanosine(37)-N1)-methyltransferase TrmD [Oscillospiraceae bacterium]
MRIDIMTLFPAMIEGVLSESILGRARKAGLLDIRTHNIRDYSEDKHHRVDDTPYGGGMGMLMAAPPIYRCYESILATAAEAKPHVIYLSPQGKVLTQQKAKTLATYEHLVLLCGHYEGIDERILEEIVDEELSVGNYVLTGGEIPACLLVDCVGRLIDGVLPASECHEIESISCGMLEYPQYTRPVVFRGRKVPDPLLNGNHAEINAWRFKEALKRTRKKRPDLL